MRLIKAPFGKRCNAPRKHDEGTFRFEPYRTIVPDECGKLAKFCVTDGDKFTKYFCRHHEPQMQGPEAEKKRARKIRRRLKKAGMTVVAAPKETILKPEASPLVRPADSRIILPGQYPLGKHNTPR